MNNYLTILLFLLSACFVCKAQENKPGQPIGGIIVKGGRNTITSTPISARPGEPIGGIVVKGGRNPGGQMKMISNTNGEFSFQNPNKGDFQFTIELPETITENENNARPGGPIGGIIVKGGKNPGGQLFTLMSDENGVITLKNLPAGNYKFKITNPSKAENPLYESSGNSGSNPMFEKSSLARPGTPIGGVIVKGGKNPGGQMKMISNSNGEFTFENSNVSDIQFIIESPEINTSNGNNARPGGPIGGIIVKGGKNPGGQLFTLISDENGVITLKNLPKGNYKFKIMVPTKAENPLYKFK